MATPDAIGAPGATQSLSNAQFGGVAIPVAHGAQPHPHDHGMIGNGTPLSAMASNFGSIKTAATWRKPNVVLPYSTATQGSVFNPYGTPG